MAKYTKIAIVYGFLEILDEKAFDKVTVRDICERCEINRNTFYYYFEDVYDVLKTVFEIEKERVLKEINTESSFLEEYRRSAAIILNNKRAIIHIYQSKNGDILQNYLKTVINDFVRRAVEKAASGTNLSEEDLKYITGFYSFAILGSTMSWIEKGMPPYKEDLLNRVAESFEATINDLINMCVNNHNKQ